MIVRIDLILERPISPCRSQGRGLRGDVCKTLFHYLIKVSERRAASSTFSLTLGEFFSGLWQNQVKEEQSRLLVLEVTRVSFCCVLVAGTCTVTDIYLHCRMPQSGLV